MECASGDEMVTNGIDVKRNEDDIPKATGNNVELNTC